MTPVDLAVDMGGTRIKCGVVCDGEVHQTHIFPTPQDEGMAATLEAVRRVLLALLASSGLRLDGCRGVGWGFPALVDHDRYRVRNAYDKYLDAPDTDFVGWSRESLGLPAAIENDARLALIGEWQHGAARGCDNCAIITLGTGIGTAVVMNGRLVRGPRGAAGNLGGHFAVLEGGRPCACGSHGCYEGETGTAALPSVARDTPGFPHSPLAQEQILDHAAVFFHAAAGDPCATAVRDRNLLLWGRLCIDMVRAYDLDRIVVGGGVMREPQKVLPSLQHKVDGELNMPGVAVRLVAAEHGDRMALLGVPWLIDECLEKP